MLLDCQPLASGIAFGKGKKAPKFEPEGRQSLELVI